MRGPLLSLLVTCSLAACAPAAPPAAAAAAVAVADSTSVRLRNLGEGLRLMQRGYPQLMRDAGVTGDVSVDLALNADGTVRDARVHRTSAELFSRPSLDVAERLRFSPPPAAGWPVRVRMKWELQGGDIQVVSR